MALKECTKKEQANSYELEVNVDGETLVTLLTEFIKSRLKASISPVSERAKLPVM